VNLEAKVGVNTKGVSTLMEMLEKEKKSISYGNRIREGRTCTI